jgi:PRTRC genetic system protein A
MVIDVHSHAAFPAGFSRRDDADDRGGIKIAAVFGKVNTAQPDIALRLVCLDQMVPLRLDGESIVVARGAAA